MSKDTFYFSHDYNARSDHKIKKLIRNHGFAGYGIYWAIIENLYDNANALPTDYETIAYDFRTDESTIKSIINDFDLFIVDGEEFGSMSVQARLSLRDEKSLKARESARKRWDKVKKDANALPTESDPIAIKESKGKESKGNKNKLIVYSSEVNDCFKICLSYFPSHLHPKDNKDWIGTIDKLNRIDEIPFNLIENIVKKARGDEFWSKNLLSLTKLRKNNPEGIKYIIVLNEKFKNGKQEKRSELAEFNNQSRLENPSI